uniref:Uncharacterized protein n=1 Tax=Anguilla anguilla TaxID=7936 RepID=A0A0E9R1I6_ANGAN
MQTSLYFNLRVFTVRSGDPCWNYSPYT